MSPPVSATLHFLRKPANNVFKINLGNFDKLLASLTGLVPTRRGSSPRYIVTLQIRLCLAVSWVLVRNRAFWLNGLTSTCILCIYISFAKGHHCVYMYLFTSSL